MGVRQTQFESMERNELAQVTFQLSNSMNTVLNFGGLLYTGYLSS